MNRAAFFLGTLALATNVAAGPIIEFNEVEPAPRTATLPLAVFGGTERKLDLSIGGINLKSASLHADLFQVAGRLAMPLGKKVIPGAVDLPGRATVPIQFPEVKSETDIVLRLSATNLTDPTPVALGEMRFAVFPRDLADEIAALIPILPNGDKRLVVFGAGRKLRPALDAMHVPFEDGGADLPGQFERSRIYIGDVTTRGVQQQAQDHGQGARLAVFSIDDSLPPGIYTTRDASDVYILVSLPVLDNLASDPRAQLVLLKVIQSLTTN